MFELENLCGTLFELSNDDRLRILHQLSKEPKNITDLAKTLELTTQECSRHASRLDDVKLTHKDTAGLHHLTTYGELVLKQLKGLEFTSRHKNYFASHSLTHIPQEFIFRLGELEDSRYVSDVPMVFSISQKMLRKAEEYIWTITDTYLFEVLHPIKEAIEAQVKVRNLERRDFFLPPRFKEDYPADCKETLDRARTTGSLEERVLKRIDIYLYMSEKEVAALAFPSLDGKFDYIGFTATDERSHKWCEDLFKYYWKLASGREDVAEELYRIIKKKPNAISVFRKIASKETVTHGKELVPELERLYLIKQGELTKIGELVYSKLQQRVR